MIICDIQKYAIFPIQLQKDMWEYQEKKRKHLDFTISIDSQATFVCGSISKMKMDDRSLQCIEFKNMFKCVHKTHWAEYTHLQS